jgi:hypothetical protein
MTDTIATLGVTLKGDAKALDAALAKAERDLRAFERQAGRTTIQMPTVRGGADPFAPMTRSAGTARDGVLALAQANARLATAQGSPAQGAQILSRALDRVAVSSTQTIGAQTQLANLQSRIARESATASGGIGGLSSAVGGLQSAFGALGIGVGLQQVVQFGVESITAANRLEDMQSSLRAIAGDTETYNNVIAEARINQELFGGTLAENVEDMTSFVISSRIAGVEMGTLIDISKRLATLDPGAGLKGANIALRELLSGNPRSLAARFELPAAALRVMGDESLTATQKLAVLDEFLNSVGISSEALNARLENTSQSYRDLGIAVDSLKESIGSILAEALAPTAEGAATLAAGFSDLFERLAGGADIIQAMNQAALESATSFEDYQERMRMAAEQTGVFLQSSQLIQGQLGFFAPLFNAAAGGAGMFGGSVGNLGQQQVEAAIAAREQAAAVTDAAAAYSDGYGQAVNLDGAIQSAAGSMNLADAAATAEAAALRDATAAAFEQANAGATLEDQARAAAQELLGAGAAGASAAAQLASSSSQIDVMTAAFYRLLAAKQAALGGGGALGGLGGVVKGAGQATAAMRTLNKVYNAGPLAPRPTGGGGGGGGGRGAGGGGGGASAATKAADAEIKAAQDRAAKVDEIEERARETALAAEEAYQEERLSVIERYNEAVLEAQRDLQAESAGSRADFYDSLTQSDVPPEIAQQLSAAYETAFAEAQRLSQAGQAALAADYLALKQDQIAAEQKFQEAVQAAREKGDKAEVARLEQIKRLRDAEFAARESNLMAEGDQNVEARDAGLTDAEVKRQEALADAQAATAKAALDAEGKTLEAARLTNDTYLERLRLLQQIGPQAGGVPALPAVAAPDATATATALPAAPTGGGAVPVSDATVAELVRQSISTMQAVERAVGRINQRGTVGGLG